MHLLRTYNALTMYLLDQQLLAELLDEFDLLTAVQQVVEPLQHRAILRGGG